MSRAQPEAPTQGCSSRSLGRSSLRTLAALLPLLLLALALLCQQSSAEYGIDAKVSSARAWLPERLHLVKVDVDGRSLQQVRRRGRCGCRASPCCAPASPRQPCRTAARSQHRGVRSTTPACVLACRHPNRRRRRAGDGRLPRLLLHAAPAADGQGAGVQRQRAQVGPRSSREQPARRRKRSGSRAAAAPGCPHRRSPADLPPSLPRPCRLRRVAQDLLLGKPLKFGILGGSISWGEGVARGREDWFSAFTLAVQQLVGGRGSRRAWAGRRRRRRLAAAQGGAAAEGSGSRALHPCTGGLTLPARPPTRPPRSRSRRCRAPT
jgi:hypothetical protein